MIKLNWFQIENNKDQINCYKNIRTKLNATSKCRDQYSIFAYLLKEKWHVYNIFTTNPKWQVVTGCYCWSKKVILVLVSNLNQ